MVAWGFALGFKFGHLSPTQFANRASELGYRWAALELDDYANAERWGPFQHACRNAVPYPLRRGPWFTEGKNVANTPSDADFTIVEVESEEDRQGVLNAPTPTVPHYVITNFTPMTDGAGVPLPAMAQPLIDRGYGCMPEAYLGETNNPDEVVFRATVQLGWPTAYPVFGLHKAPMTAYDPYKARYSKYGIYLAEYVL